MILEIKKAIIKNLKQKFTDHKVYAEEVEQGLVKPCFFVEIIPISTEKLTTNMQERSVLVDVQYLSVEETNAKNLEMSEILPELFETLEFGSFKVTLTNQHFETVDSILHFLFDMDFVFMVRPIEESELMQEVIIEKEVI